MKQLSFILRNSVIYVRYIINNEIKECFESFRVFKGDSIENSIASLIIKIFDFDIDISKIRGHGLNGAAAILINSTSFKPK